MRNSFSHCAAVIVLSMMVSGCYSNGKWTMPWQGSSPFSSTSTPTSTNVANATKPSTLAGNNTPPSNVAAPSVSFPPYQGSAPGMNNRNNVAPSYQATNPPADPMSGTYTASSNNSASRAGASVTPQQGTYPVNNSATPNASPAVNNYGTPSTTASPYGGTAPSGGFSVNPSSSTAPTNNNYGAPYGGNTSTPSTTPYGGSSYHSPNTQPATSSYPAGGNNAGSVSANMAPSAGPVTGRYDAGGWNSIPANNPTRPNEPAGGDRYSSNNDRYGSNAGNPNNIAGGASSTAAPDSRYGNAPATPTPDPRYGILPTVSTSDSRYGNNAPATTADLRNNQPLDNGNGNMNGNVDRYGTGAPASTPTISYPPADNGSNASFPNAGVSSVTPKPSGIYQPGSVSAYDPANKPTVITANTSSNPTSR